jgi:peptide/nickel transport system permease protein
MIAFVIRRVFQSIIVVLIVGLIAFLMFRYVGDPIESLLGQERTFEDIANLRERLGLNDPFVVQYFNFLWGAVQGEFGISYRAGVPVSQLIGERCRPRWSLRSSPACSRWSAGLRWACTRRCAARASSPPPS